MTVHLMDSMIFGGSISNPKMQAVFQEEARIQHWLDVEAALAHAEALLGIIPESSAQRIKALARIENLDFETIKSHGKVTGHSLVGFLKEFRRVIGPEDAQYLHWGATTQDIIDTAQILSLKKALVIIDDQIVSVMTRLLDLMETHRQTVMVGRTHGGQALPITFGLKIATWLDELSRQLERLRSMKKRVLVGNMTGAVGTFASWGQNGFKVQQLTLERLGLGIPDTCWHSARDRIAEVMTLFGLIASTGARIAKEVYNLSKTEISELQEPFKEGMVGSSTMPHKRNPIHSEWTIVLSKILRSNAGLAMDAMVLENERDATAWKTEWIIVPESTVMLSSLLSHLVSLFSGLIVSKKQMQTNMDRLKGLLLSEPLMFTLSQSMPLPAAFEKVYQASMRAFENETPLLDELLMDPEIKENYASEHLQKVLEPKNYLGLGNQTIDRVKTKVTSIINPQ